ncbi:5,10-methylene tetrahydromethanopterin reductase [Amycolatopsis sp. WAC 01376]|uniref:LLM class flavin-dependent oxidoreductase n=1 Tax=Amycolatopsis sp. WAC 01376 TaxID=2203195 RepID=UPI000F78ACF3|nr:LLM class flavin-dependent oxidoreductase [Amycolatopsis sp. WAC 01376]RSM63055.1 5,10-methylene tetrahydromethanopterin reductase [Amycolatopsis sp. WAC 01376]
MVSYSVHVPFLPADIDRIAPLISLVNRARSRLWLGQSVTVEPHQLFAYFAGRGMRVPVGTSVTLMPLRNPFEAAVQARSLAQLTGHPVVAGYGPGPAGFQRALLGSAYRSPLTATREYLTSIRSLLNGDTVTLDTGYTRLNAALPSMPHPRVELGLGVLRAGMARLAGEIADVAITWLCPPDYLRNVLIPEIALAAAAANRPMPRVVSVVHIAERKPKRDPVQLARTVCGPHLQSAHYVDMLGKAGIHIDPADPESGARALVDAGIFLTGTMPELLSGLSAYQSAGADEVVLNLSAVGAHRGAQVALREMEFLLTSVEALRPGSW